MPFWHGLRLSHRIQGRHQATDRIGPPRPKETRRLFAGHSISSGSKALPTSKPCPRPTACLPCGANSSPASPRRWCRRARETGPGRFEAEHGHGPQIPGGPGPARARLSGERFGGTQLPDVRCRESLEVSIHARTWRAIVGASPSRQAHTVSIHARTWRAMTWEEAQGWQWWVSIHARTWRAIE